MHYLKLLFLYVVNISNTLILFATLPGLGLKGTRCVFVSIKAAASSVQCFNCTLKRVRLTIDGANNQFICSNAKLNNTSITIAGSGNVVQIESGVILREGTLIVRGNNCSIYIGKGTTFGGVRIITVGDGSSVQIGEDCLFADNIEIWSSDTHPIYDETDTVINPHGNINISDRVWVGARAVILKNVSIGADCVVGMSSVVSKSVEKSSVVVGNPCRVVRQGIKWGLNYPNVGGL